MLKTRYFDYISYNSKLTDKLKSKNMATKKAKSKAPKLSSKKAVKTAKVKVASLGQLTRKTDRTELNAQTWVVFRGPTGEKKPLLFDAKLSRDAVRSAYVRLTGVNHVSTRSRRLKNY